jgi:transcriptional regulator with XRE-family HTH domain
MKSKELCIFLERLRFARNISQEAFTDDVTSIRQYRRYLSGESDIPFQIVAKLTSKLGVKTDSLLREFEVARIEETSIINKLYNLAVNYSQDEFMEISKRIPLDHIIEHSNRLMYQHSIIINKMFTKKITKLEAANENAKLINYPKMLNQLVMTSVEMLILSSFLDLFDESQHQAIIEKITDYIKDQTTVISGGNEKFYSLVLARLAKYMGVTQDFESVIAYCKQGITRNIESKSYYLMDYFYYYSSLAYYRLGNTVEYEKNLVSCFNVLQFEGNEKKIEKFRNLIDHDFDISFELFVTNYYQNRQNKAKE